MHINNDIVNTNSSKTASPDGFPNFTQRILNNQQWLYKTEKPLMTPEISKIIRVLRLPLMIMVVFIHSYLIETPDMPAVTIVENIFSRTLSSVAVPLFMFFAGYLFFVKMDSFSLNFYGRQLKKRTHTLLIPYLIWNTLVIIAFWLMHRYFPTLINPDFENVAVFPLAKLADCYWNGSSSFPIAYQFWFIRDLMIIVLLSPQIAGIYAATNSKKYLFVSCLTLLYLIVNNTFSDMCYFFIIGGWCAYAKVDFVKQSRGFQPYAAIVFLITFIGRLAFPELDILRKLFIISFSITILSCKGLVSDNIFTRLMERYSSSSFFVFAIHGMIALLSCKVIVAILSSQNQLVWICAYFGNILLITIFSIICYYDLKRVVPSVLKILSGNR